MKVNNSQAFCNLLQVEMNLRRGKNLSKNEDKGFPFSLGVLKFKRYETTKKGQEQQEQKQRKVIKGSLTLSTCEGESGALHPIPTSSSVPKTKQGFDKGHNTGTRTSRGCRMCSRRKG